MKISRALKAKILSAAKPEAPRKRKVSVFSFSKWRMNESEIETFCNRAGLVSVSICSLDERLYCAVVYEEATR